MYQHSPILYWDLGAEHRDGSDNLAVTPNKDLEVAGGVEIKNRTGADVPTWKRVRPFTFPQKREMST